MVTFTECLFQTVNKKEIGCCLLQLQMSSASYPDLKSLLILLLLLLLLLLVCFIKGMLANLFFFFQCCFLGELSVTLTKILKKSEPTQLLISSRTCWQRRWSKWWSGVPGVPWSEWTGISSGGSSRLHPGTIPSLWCSPHYNPRDNVQSAGETSTFIF